MNQEKNKLTFLLADDHSLIRQGIFFLIDEMKLETEIFQTSNLQQTLDKIKNNPIDIAIIDAHFPDGNSLSILKEIKTICPEIRILIYTGIDENTHALKYIKAGANGFLSKMSEEIEIKYAVEEMINHGEYISKSTQSKLIDSVQNPSLINPLFKLTEREIEIAEMYAAGLGNLEIANRLDLKQNSVSTMKKRILEKLEIDSIVALIDLIKTHKF